MPTPGTDPHGLGDTERFEASDPGWKGYVTHAGGVRMAQVMIMQRMAEAMGDGEHLGKCNEWLEAGSRALEEHLRAGRYYLNSNDPEKGQKSDLILGYQLDGQWITRWHGLSGVFPQERVDTTPKTIRDANCRLSRTGAVNYTNPDGSVARIGGYGAYSYSPPELFMLAITYMVEGQREFGLELLHRCPYNIICRWGYTRDMPNITRADTDTGQRTFGADYYQDMMLWAWLFRGLASIKGFARNPHTGVVAICSRTTGEARRKLEETGVSCTVHQSFEDMLADDAVDIVSICTPNNLHAEEGIRAARAGHAHTAAAMTNPLRARDTEHP